MGRLGWMVAICVVVVLGAVSGASVVAWNHDRDNRAKLQPLVEAVDGFAVPDGAKQSLPEVRTTKPPRIVRAWSDPSAVDAACSKWGNAFRLWIGEDQSLGAVTGELMPGQSCTLQAEKNGYKANLVVAAYGTEPPQALLTLGG